MLPRPLGLSRQTVGNVLNSMFNDPSSGFGPHVFELLSFSLKTRCMPEYS